MGTRKWHRRATGLMTLARYSAMASESHLDITVNQHRHPRPLGERLRELISAANSGVSNSVFLGKRNAEACSSNQGRRDHDE